jgi:hypothetical protein
MAQFPTAQFQLLGVDRQMTIYQNGLQDDNPLFSWQPHTMFVRKILVEYEHDGRMIPCPVKWLDTFAMRSFTNATIFDDTLPLTDGLIEIGSNVPLGQLKDAMEDWFQRKGYIPKDSKLSLAEK